MPRGTVDLFTSRRTNFIECKYWLISKEDMGKNKEDLTHNKMYDGTFDAKFENQIENTMSVIGQTFMFDSNTVSISTLDDISDLKKNCLVEFYNLVWRVNDVTRAPIKSDFQMSNEIRFKYYMELRR